MDRRVLRYEQPYNENIPEIPLDQFLLDKIRVFGSQIACVDSATKDQVTFTELIGAVERLALRLQVSEGVQKGHYVAIALNNCIEFPIALLSVVMCGAVAAFVNPVYTPRELDHVANIIQPKLWICSADFLPSLDALAKREGYKHSTKAVVVDAKEKAAEWNSNWTLAGRPAFVRPQINVYEDIATLPFSSGTTGFPKGVMLTHRNITAALIQFEVWCPYIKQDVNLGLLPMFHQYGCLIGLTTLSVGAKLIVVPKFSFVDMLNTIQEYRVTMVPLVPPIAVLLAKHPSVDQFDLSSMRGVISSAAPLSSEIISQMMNKFGCDVLQGYGMTECTLATHFTPKSVRRHGSVGVVMPFYEGKIVNLETNEDCAVGVIGEICVRGPMVMKGYRGNRSATDAMIDSDGWLHTGDIGYYDEDGWFFVVDRLKELIKYKGMQVAPSELEHLLLTHPDVSDAAVVGVPDEMAGELPKAFVVKRQGSDVTEKDIERFVNEQVAPYKRLRGGVTFLAAIPKLASGKLLRRELRALHSKL